MGLNGQQCCRRFFLVHEQSLDKQADGQTGRFHQREDRHRDRFCSHFIRRMSKENLVLARSESSCDDHRERNSIVLVLFFFVRSFFNLSRTKTKTMSFST